QDYEVLPFISAPVLVANSSAQSSYDVDVASLIAGLRANSQSVANMTFFAPGSDASGGIFSREDPVAQNQPTLTLVYSMTAPVARVAPVIVETASQWNHQPFSVDGSTSSLPGGGTSGLTYSW